MSWRTVCPRVIGLDSPRVAWTGSSVVAAEVVALGVRVWVVKTRLIVSMGILTPDVRGRNRGYRLRG
jgi:hypothetical protein